MDTEQPDGAIVALRPCGCLMLVSADLPDHRADTAIELVRCVAVGARPGYWTVAQVRDGVWSYANCQPLPEPVMTLGRPHDPLWAVNGFVEVTVCVNLSNLQVRAAGDTDKVREDLLHALNITPLVVDDDHFTVEWNDDDMTFTPISVERAAGPQAEQHALPFVTQQMDNP